MVGRITVILCSRSRDLTIGGATGTPILPLALEKLARYILRFVLPLAEPSGPEIDAYAAGEDEENASSTLDINGNSQTNREPSDATAPRWADQLGSRWVGGGRTTMKILFLRLSSRL